MAAGGTLAGCGFLCAGGSGPGPSRRSAQYRSPDRTVGAGSRAMACGRFTAGAYRNPPRHQRRDSGRGLFQTVRRHRRCGFAPRLSRNLGRCPLQRRLSGARDLSAQATHVAVAAVDRGDRGGACGGHLLPWTLPLPAKPPAIPGPRNDPAQGARRQVGGVGQDGRNAEKAAAGVERQVRR